VFLGTCLPLLFINLNKNKAYCKFNLSTIERGPRVGASWCLVVIVLPFGEGAVDLTALVGVESNHKFSRRL
jgi:hypothetical protein